jgi:hypothetical protein
VRSLEEGPRLRLRGPSAVGGLAWGARPGTLTLRPSQVPCGLPPGGGVPPSQLGLASGPLRGLAAL